VKKRLQSCQRDTLKYRETKFTPSALAANNLKKLFLERKLTSKCFVKTTQAE